MVELIIDGWSVVIIFTLIKYKYKCVETTSQKRRFCFGVIVAMIVLLAEAFTRLFTWLQSTLALISDL